MFRVGNNGQTPLKVLRVFAQILSKNNGWYRGAITFRLRPVYRGEVLFFALKTFITEVFYERTT